MSGLDEEHSFRNPAHLAFEQGAEAAVATVAQQGHLLALELEMLEGGKPLRPQAGHGRQGHGHVVGVDCGQRRPAPATGCRGCCAAAARATRRRVRPRRALALAAQATHGRLGLGMRELSSLGMKWSELRFEVGLQVKTNSGKLVFKHVSSSCSLIRYQAFWSISSFMGSSSLQYHQISGLQVD